jgi:hypothetical protein
LSEKMKWCASVNKKCIHLTQYTLRVTGKNLKETFRGTTLVFNTSSSLNDEWIKGKLKREALSVRDCDYPTILSEIVLFKRYQKFTVSLVE